MSRKNKKEVEKNTKRIVKVDDERILFSNHAEITFDHSADCCEWNYADFSQIDDLALGYTFEGPILFETVEDYGFRFGDSRRMFFVPCYSSQNGWYSSEVDIYYKNKKVLSCEGKLC